jgi:Ca-activated chloride channel homolog
MGTPGIGPFSQSQWVSPWFTNSVSRVRGACLIALVSALLAVTSAAAEETSDEVHVVPRTVSRERYLSEKAIRSSVDLVLVNVTVLDHQDHAVTGLTRTNFAVIDDKNSQTVKYLSNVDDPISIVVVLDASSSMAARVQDEQKALTELITASNPQDEFSLVVVHDRPEVVWQADTLSGESPAASAFQPAGNTALWDGLYLGIHQLRNSRYQRRAIVVISDGGDNHSRYTQSELKSLLKESDVQVYALGLFNPYPNRIEEKRGPLELDEVTSVTGGRVLSVHSSAEISRAVTRISQELRSEYVLGYYPTNRTRDGKWRKLKVRLVGTPDHTKLRLYARKGYYAAAQ